MKRRIAVLALVATALGAWAPSWAFQSVSITTVTAGAFVGGVRMAAFNLTIRDASNPLNPALTRSSITWSNPNNLVNQFKIADQVMVINSTVTDANGGIKIYTDNTSTIDASPRFVDPTPLVLTDPNSSASGLLQGNSGTTSRTFATAWSIDASTKVVNGAGTTGIRPENPTFCPLGSGPPDSFRWLNVTDRYNWAQGVDFDQNGDVTSCGDAGILALDARFPTMVGVQGLHTGQADGQFTAHDAGKDAFVYFEANFFGAPAQTIVQTTTLRVEAYIE